MNVMHENHNVKKNWQHGKCVVSHWRTWNSLIDSIASLKMKTAEGQRIRARSLAHNISRIKERAGVSGWGLKQMTSGSIIHMDLHKPSNKLVFCNWSTFGARTSHEQTQTHKIHHSPDLGETTTSPPYSIFCAWSQGQHSNVIFSRDSQVGILKFPKLKLPQLWRPIILCVDLQLKWGLTQNINPCWELSNDMW